MNSGGPVPWPALLLALLLHGSPAVAGETLDFKVTYNGVFSAFNDLAIGDVRLEVDQTAAQLEGEPIVRTRLSASSAAYPVVERLYPYRYEFTSYHQPGTARSLAFERRRQTGKLRHDLLLLDWDGHRLSRFGIAEPLAGTTARPPAVLLDLLHRAGLPDYRARFSPRPTAAATLSRATLDRVALLAQLRALPLVVGASRELTVTDGKSFIDYRATVVKRESLPMAVGPVAAWKVRIEGFDLVDGDERPRHAPVYLWLDDGPGRLPLRFVSRHAAGRFTVELQPERLQRAAVTEPSGLPILY